jgi:phosphate:Na+ symporter
MILHIETLGLFVISSLAGIALMLLGTRLLSEGLQMIFSDSIRATMTRLGESGWRSFAVGVSTSFMIQSRISSAIMAVSYTNSGLMSLRQLHLFLIGTTFGTVFFPWLFLIETGRLDLLLLALGILPMLYATQDSFAGFGRVIFSLGLLLFGFDVVAFGSSNPDTILFYIRDWWAFDGQVSMGESLGLSLLALLFMFAFRSTVVLIGFLMALSASGILTASTAVVATVGLNLGAALLPLWNSRPAHVMSQRGLAVYVANHFLVAFGFVIFLDSYLNWIEPVVTGLSFWTTAHALMFANIVVTPLTHFVFNGMTAIVSLLIQPLWLRWLDQPERSPKEKHKYRLQYFGRPSHLAPSLAIEQVSQEVKKLAAMVHSMLHLTLDTIGPESPSSELRVRKHETISDNLFNEMTTFVAKTLQAHLSKAQSFEAVCLLQTALELEKIADCGEDVIEYLEKSPASGEISNQVRGYLQIAAGAYEHIFPLLTDDMNTDRRSMDAFSRDLDAIALQSVRFYDLLVESGFRQKQEYESGLGAINAIRRVVESSRSIVDIRKRYWTISTGSIS